jgi:hypothetical protein
LLPTAACNLISNCWRGSNSLSFSHQALAAPVRLVLVRDERQRVYILAVDLNVQFHQRARLVAGQLVVERAYPLVRDLS